MALTINNPTLRSRGMSLLVGVTPTRTWRTHALVQFDNPTSNGQVWAELFVGPAAVGPWTAMDAVMADPGESGATAVQVRGRFQSAEGEGTRYVRLHIINAEGEAEWVAATAELVPAAGAPTTPTGFGVLEILAGQITMAWTDASPNELGFRLQFRTVGATAWFTLDLEPNAERAVLRGLAAGAYEFRLQAIAPVPHDTWTATVTATIAVGEGSAAPVILPVQSVLYYTQWQYWEFQPGATGYPTVWTITGLPPGLEYWPASGKIWGAATVPGTYVITMVARNSFGVSSRSFTIGIYSAGVSLPDPHIEIFIETASRQVAVLTPPPFPDSDKPDIAAAILALKSGDVQLVRIRYYKGETYVNPDVVGLKMVFKEYDTEDVIFEADTHVGHLAGSDAWEELVIDLSDPLIASTLLNYDEDAGTRFAALAEIEWTYLNPSTIGPILLRATSRTFGVVLVRELAENA